MKKLLYLLLFVSYSSYSQDYGNKEDAIKLCTVIQSNNFISDTSADNALEKILSVIGASKRFVLQPCDNINNAIATSFNGIRYILYDRDFMNTLDNENNWGNLFILAHEVGHHINGHSLDMLLYKSIEPKTLSQRRQQELEADEFAGFVLAKLGGSLQDVNQLIIRISNNSEDSFSTHPSRSKRLTAVGNGYKKATNNETIYSNNSTEITAEDYFYSGILKFNLQDYIGAIADYSKSIELNPNESNTYYNRGLPKAELQDYIGAIADFSKAIELNPNKSNTYYSRGISKAELQDYRGAIADYSKAIELNPTFPHKIYTNRGISKAKLQDYIGAIADCSKAIELNPNESVIYYNRGNYKYKLQDYIGSIADFSKAIELNPNYSPAYTNRAISKFYLNQKNSACLDWSKAGELGYGRAYDLIKKYCN